MSGQADHGGLASLGMIGELLAFDTTSARSNLDLIDHVRGYLAGLGVDSRLVKDETGQKANLYAVVGPADVPGLMLSGHTDVVPVDDQDWTVEPFAATRRDGRVYGRGSADMKAFIGIALAYVPQMLERDLTMPIHLAFSYDEEIGCVGARRLVDMLNGLDVKPAMCVVGEPTEMKVVTGHKGKRSFTVMVRGRECHSSLAPQGVNAIDYAAELIVFIRALAARLAQDGRRDDDYDVPYSTIHTGVIGGGTVLNIVPSLCRFEFEIRDVAGEDTQALVDEIVRYARETLEPAMQAVAPGTGFGFEEVSAYPGLDLDPAEEVVALVKALTGENAQSKTAFGTEAGLFHNAAGIPAVVCGPGSIAQAHKPDEFITLDQIARGEQFMARLLDRLAR